VAGVIFGILDHTNNIDVPKNKLLLKECETLCPCFHMAIDNTPDISASLETLIELGFKRVLTKGGNYQNAE
jgi:copper homeostasis protein